MAVITFPCFACNQVLQVGAENAGRRARCSRCGTILTVPLLAAEVQVVAETLPTAAPLQQTKAEFSPAAPVPPAAIPPLQAPPLSSVPPLPTVAPRPGPRADFDDVEVIEEGPLPAGPLPAGPPREGPSREGPSRRPIDDDWDEPPRRRRSASDLDVRKRPAPTWDKVKIGFLLVFIGLCVTSGALGLYVLGALILNTGVSGQAGLVFIRMGATVMFLGNAAAIVGHAFWLFITNKRGARAFGIAALAVAGVYELFLIVYMAQVYGTRSGIGGAVFVLVSLLRAAHYMMIAFYLRALVQTVARGPALDLERGAMLNIILTGCLAGYDLITGIVLLGMYGTGAYWVTFWIFFWLGAILTGVVIVFTILAVYNGKKLVDDLARPIESSDD